MGIPAEKGHCLLLLEGFCPLPGRRQGSCSTALGTGPSLEVKVEEHQRPVLAWWKGIAAMASGVCASVGSRGCPDYVRGVSLELVRPFFFFSRGV